jgi:hypothetical protein
MTTTRAEPTKRDLTCADTHRVPVGDPASPGQGVADPGGLRWWRADPDDWMRRAAGRPQFTIFGVFDDEG